MQKLDAKQQLAEAVKRLQTIERSRAFDPYRPNSRPTPQQEEILRDIKKVNHRYGLGGNQSGKSSIGGRECSWVFTETHPYWSRPNSHTCGKCDSKSVKLIDVETETYQCNDCNHAWVDWKDEPLTLIVVARTTEQYTELWEKKIKPFLTEGTYREEKAGGTLQRVINKENHNKLLFFSHHSPEEAREKVQMFVANYLWLDEMPRSYKLLEELHRRCQSKSAPFLATFTPKVIEKTIRKMVDNETPYQKKYHLKTLDNPINKNAQKQAEILASMSALTKEMQDTLLEGAWFGGELAVYEFTDRNIQDPNKVGYHKGWRHLEFIDPAASGLAGWGLLAENPETAKWYVVVAKYLKGAAASDLLDTIEKETYGYNIVKSVCDPHETWFIKEAQKRGRKYIGVHKKNERKQELIKGLQESLNADRMAVAPWCEDACDEFNTAQWSETVPGKIVGGKNYHITDGLQYANDNLPKPETKQQPTTWAQDIRASNERRKRREAAKKQFIQVNKFARILARGGKVIRRD